ncbi:hypothetical protein F5Y13DRAFT_184231 [Hypoxylon sp. FL1857]|nr:hypothetical protein F5Y13DRAFT_184231 [Hypoxylon sp. FL1857]
MEPNLDRDGGYWTLDHSKSLIKRRPHLWFGTSPISPRDHELISCDDTSFAECGFPGASPLCSVSHLKQGETNDVMHQTCWTCENDMACKTMVAQAGGSVSGFPELASLPAWYQFHMKVEVKVTISMTSRSELVVPCGLFSTRPTKIRTLQVPSHIPGHICPFSPPEVMIMYDCTSSSESFRKHPFIASRKWDVLLMKIYENYEFPWTIVSIVDSGSSDEVKDEDDELYTSLIHQPDNSAF